MWKARINSGISLGGEQSGHGPKVEERHTFHRASIHGFYDPCSCVTLFKIDFQNENFWELKILVLTNITLSVGANKVKFEKRASQIHSIKLSATGLA